jgi:hypothetical protein
MVSDYSKMHLHRLSAAFAGTERTVYDGSIYLYSTWQIHENKVSSRIVDAMQLMK